MKGKILSSLLALLLVGGLNTLAAPTNTQSEATKEQSDPALLSPVTITQDENTLIYSYDDGNTWTPVPEVEMPEFYSHDEFLAWIKEQETEIAKLVEAGEWTQEKTDTTIQEYYDLLASSDNGLLISKRESYTDDQYFVSIPNTPHTQGFQTSLFTESGYEFFGPYDTEKELYDALKAYTELQVETGNMTANEANTILEKYE
jgi:hypothetical protein